MNNIITYSFCESFLDRFVDDLEQDYLQAQAQGSSSSKDLSRIAIVFGGHRPALFVKRSLSKKIGKAFYPPRFFSIDEFMGYVTAKHEKFESTQDLDQCYLIFKLVKENCPQLLVKRETFAQFLPWAREILSFIEQLDLECVDNDKLKGVEQNAQIGYDVPQDINEILAEITLLRDVYHQYMMESKIYTRGFQYQRASELIVDTQFEEFDDILFANFFYFNRAEEAVVKTLYETDRARLFFQGDQRRWPVFQRIACTLNTDIKEGKEVDQPKFDLKLYRGFDVHSQICQLREILKTIPDLNKTVIVLPDPDNIIPLLSEIGPMVKDFNISMGYPLKRSSLVSLITQVFAAQNSKDARGYYVHDYLKVIKHPLIKNLMLHDDMQPVRVLIHKIEEVLTGAAEGDISGCLFLDLKDVVACKTIFESAHDTFQSMGINVNAEALEVILNEIHRQCFSVWETVRDFKHFAQTLHGFLDLLVSKSLLKNYPLNLRIASKIYDIGDELAKVEFAHEKFPCEDIFRIFSSKIEREIVAFIGSPLKGLQILGLFETRALNFDHVIVMDTNEGVLPHLNIYGALIPRDVMIALNLDRLEQEEEIQRYGFMRLISSAKNVYLLYQENRERERSRFVEELVWEKEKAQAQVGVVPVMRSGFAVSAQAQKHEMQKTPQMIEFLKNCRYSASSIHTYLRDPMEFYYQYVLGLREQDDLLDEPENRQIGIFIHEFLEEVFKGFIGKPLVIDKIFMEYSRAVFQARFQDYFGKSRRPDTFFLKRVVETRLNQFLMREAERSPAIERIECLEKPFDLSIPLSCGEIKVKGVVDRIDRMRDGSLFILDYKTGHVGHLLPKELSEVEAVSRDREDILETIRSFQLPLYFYSIRRLYHERNIYSGFYNLRTQEIKTLLGDKVMGEAVRVEQAFLRALNFIIEEILNPEIPFVRVEPSGR